MTALIEGGEWSAARPGRTLRHGKDPVPILQEAGFDRTETAKCSELS